MTVTIKKADKLIDADKISVNMIYNRFDLFCAKEEYEVVKIINGTEEKYVQYRLYPNWAEIALWLVPITVEEVQALVKYIADNHKNVKEVVYKNGVVPCGKAKEHNHFRVIFPDTAEEMKNRVSPKSWSKMRRRNRRAAEVYGEMSLIEYENGNIPLDIVETFFEYKKQSHGRTYDMTAEEYLSRYHVTDCYVVKFGDTVGALHFCCEQCPVVYGENHAYNPEMLEYSLGKFIFAHSLVRIAEKKHTEIFLAGGDYEYKTHYGSVEETLYDCKIIIPDPAPQPKPAPKPTPKPAPKQDTSLKGRAKAFAKKHLPAPLFNALKKLKNAIKG